MLFLEEFSALLEQIMAESTASYLYLVTSIYTDVDDPYNTYANRFNEILESCNLKHFVSGATHANGHTLNLVISKKKKMIISLLKSKLYQPCNLGSPCGSL